VSRGVPTGRAVLKRAAPTTNGNAPLPCTVLETEIRVGPLGEPMQQSNRPVWYQPIRSRRGTWEKKERQACKRLMLDLKRLRDHAIAAPIADDERA
jgi:hypothetical protein